MVDIFSHIRLRVFAWVFLRIVASYRLKLIFVIVVRNEMELSVVGEEVFVRPNRVARKRSGGRIYGEAL